MLHLIRLRHSRMCRLANMRAFSNWLAPSTSDIEVLNYPHPKVWKCVNIPDVSDWILLIQQILCHMIVFLIAQGNMWRSASSRDSPTPLHFSSCSAYVRTNVCQRWSRHGSPTGKQAHHTSLINEIRTLCNIIYYVIYYTASCIRCHPRLE